MTRAGGLDGYSALKILAETVDIAGDAQRSQGGESGQQAELGFLADVAASLQVVGKVAAQGEGNECQQCYRKAISQEPVSALRQMPGDTVPRVERAPARSGSMRTGAAYGAVWQTRFLK